MFIVGIDLGNEYSQVCYYNFAAAEPESVNFAPPAVQYRVPTVVLREEQEDGAGWLAGDIAVSCKALGKGVLFDELLTKAMNKEPIKAEDVTVMPLKLMTVFFAYLIQSVKAAFGDEEIDKICVTLEDYNISVLKVVEKALHALGISADKILLSSHVESAVYYVYSQKAELCRNEIALFDYGKKGLIYHKTVSVNDRGTRIIMSQSRDYRKEVPFTENMEQLQEKLLETARAEFDKKMISTVYLTGEGFDEGFSGERFINYICNRRRVFAGQNLYAKGACYQAYEVCVGDGFKNTLLGCKERITTGIEMKISDRGKEKILRMVKPGINWYGADCSYDFIVDDCSELEIFLSPMDSKEKQLVRISLSEFPVRENKTTRITVALSFTSDKRCHLMVTDKGFGGFVKSSGRVINEDLLL